MFETLVKLLFHIVFFVATMHVYGELKIINKDLLTNWLITLGLV